MGSRRRRRRAVRAILLLAALAALILAALACALFLLRPRAMDKSLPSAAPPQGTLFGLHLSQELPAGEGALSDCDPEALDALFAEAADYARAHGMNALLLDVAGARLSGVAFRDRVYETWSGAKDGGSLLSPYDPLRALCERASEAGLSVYAVTPSAGGDADWAAALERLRERYAVAGVCTWDGALYSEAGLPLFYAGGEAFADPSSLFFASLEAGGLTGAVFDYAQCRADPQAFSLLASAMDEGAPRPALLDFTPSPALAISYPEDGAAISTEQCFLMGTSDPSQPLLLNGEPVESRALGGTFGVLADVAQGENTYTFTQGGDTASVTVMRGGAGGSGASGSGGTAAQHDATKEVAPYTIIRTTGWITSLLYDPSSDGNISETVRRGAQAAVVSCVETVRGGRRTWAYRLESGDYVLAYNTEAVSGDAVRPSFTGASAQPTASGETITFTGAGTPLAYTNIVAGRLEMDFYDADFAPDFAVAGSSMVESVSVTPGDASTRVTLTFHEPIWGHTVEYADGTTQVLLKKTPVRSGVFGKPLTGVTVLLDAGHGDQDGGAMGAAGYGAPVEKDVNLAVALAAKYRLEQLGATVQAIRTDDSFLSLEERNAAISTGQPDFFIAIHHNSVELDIDANGQTGTECYYFYGTGDALAQALVRNVTEATGRPARGALWSYYYVTRNATCPAVLLEIGFMVNPVEYEQVTSERQIWNAADAVARSVLECVPERAG